MKKYDIKFLAMDVDGTLTDGKIYMGPSGELFKAFDTKDGCGIKDILPALGITPIIITARESQIVTNRCKELGIVESHQGCRDKFGKLCEILKKSEETDGCQYALANVAYIGDDLLDLQCIESIKDCGGFTACPANAVEEIKSVVDFVCTKNAGNGSVRELIDFLKNNLLNKL